MIMECKKCKRPLTKGTKYKTCENCRGKKAQGLKEFVAVGGTLLSLAVVVISRGKINPRGK